MIIDEKPKTTPNLAKKCSADRSAELPSKPLVVGKWRGINHPRYEFRLVRVRNFKVCIMATKQPPESPFSKGELNKFRAIRFKSVSRIYPMQNP